MSQASSSPASSSEPTACIQRRLHYRVAVVPTSVLQVRVWKIPQQHGLAQKPLPSQELKVVVRQICAGGLSVTVLGKEGQPPVISTVDRLRIEINCGSESALVEGRFRAAHAMSGVDVQTGIHILPRQIDKAAKFTRLPAIVGIAQQEELRFLRQSSNTQAA